MLMLHCIPNHSHHVLQVEAMKSRKAARAMAEYLRQLNPQLAAAMTDERDEVPVMLIQTGFEHTLQGYITSCCLQNPQHAAHHHLSP